MGKLVIDIDDELEQAFRHAAAKKYGLKQGFVKGAVEEAIREWLEKESKK